jgi:hypothetical protein
MMEDRFFKFLFTTTFLYFGIAMWCALVQCTTSISTLLYFTLMEVCFGTAYWVVNIEI